MTDKNAILFAWKFDGKGGGEALSGDNVSLEIKGTNLAWVHMDATHKHTRKWLNKEVDYLDDIILDALLAEETRPRILEFKEGMLLILRSMNFNQGAELEDMLSVRVWIDPYRIISLERRYVKAVRDIAESLAHNVGPVSSGDFLTQIVMRLLEDMEPVLASLDERTDIIEEKVMEQPDLRERQIIVDIRKQAITFRRYILPQRDILRYLQTSTLPWMELQHRRHIQESYDIASRYVEDLEMTRERTQIIKDELTNTLSERLNKNLYILSVIAAVFLPLGFLTGLFGINIGGVPGIDNPHAFWTFTGMLTILVLLQILIFKMLKWF